MQFPNAELDETACLTHLPFLSPSPLCDELEPRIGTKRWITKVFVEDRPLAGVACTVPLRGRTFAA